MASMLETSFRISE